MYAKNRMGNNSRVGDATAGKSKEIKRDEFLATKHSIPALLAAKLAVRAFFTERWGGDAFFFSKTSLMQV